MQPNQLASPAHDMFSQNSQRIIHNEETSPKKEIVYHSAKKHKPIVKSNSNLIIEET